MDNTASKMKPLLKRIALFVVAISCFALPAKADENKIEKVDFSMLTGGRTIIDVTTTSPLPNPPAGFTLKNPPRIALDFPNTSSALSKNSLTADQGALKNVLVAQTKDRTRMVLNLSAESSFTTETQGNKVRIILSDNKPSTVDNATVTKFAEPALDATGHAVKNVDFARGKNGEGRIMIDLSDTSTGINIKQQGKKIVVDILDADISEKLERRLNVINFNTPVLYVDTVKQGKNVRLSIEPQGLWEHSAYQADKRFIIDVRKIVEDPNKLVQGSKPGYAGEKLSLNFQNIDVRSVLQVIADFTGLNIITSDTVTGNITLRLKDVPWDQALDIIMQSKGLTQRKNGNVIVVAPTEEVAAKDKATLEASKQIEDLEPLRTEVFTLKYMKADSLKLILTDEKQRILSKRGSAVLDPRTNTIFVQDLPKKLDEIRAMITKTDIPVRQVMIESRLVLANENFGKSLGARFGFTQTGTPGADGTRITTSSTIGNRPTGFQDGQLTQGLHNGSVQTALTDVLNKSQRFNLNSTLTSSDGQPDLNVNLPASALGANAAGALALTLFRLPAGLLLNMELSAMETDSRGKVISSPRVTTANQQKAYIESGTEIGYQQASASGATNIAFKKAVLGLEVTPQVTPDENIIMDLLVKKDSVGDIIAGVPSINTQKVETQVLVGNGETAVLGGIYEEEEVKRTEKVPFFGDLPAVGRLFKTNTSTNGKKELLIFVTPKVMNENLDLK